MDKSFGTLYNKITNLFHSNPSSASVPEASSSLPISNFFDRLVPTTTITTTSCSPINQHRSSSRISRQISIKTTDNRIKPVNDLPQQQM